MPRHFVDFLDGEMWLKDDERQEYQSLQAPRHAAMAVLPDIGREAQPSDGKHDFVAYPHNQSGAQLCTVRLNFAAECRPDRRDINR